jgi:hypothetical protein
MVPLAWRGTYLWYVPALVRRPGRGLRTLCGVVLAGAAACATLASGGSAENAGQLERQADALRAQNAELNAGAQSAATGLVTIERRLSQARAELASFQARAAEVRARRRAVTQELRIARSALRLTQRALARRLQALYEQGDEDTLAVILGAGSLEGMLNAIETMDLAATQDEDLIVKARSASKQLARLSRRLAARERELQQLPRHAPRQLRPWRTPGPSGWKRLPRSARRARPTRPRSPCSTPARARWPLCRRRALSSATCPARRCFHRQGRAASDP